MDCRNCSTTDYFSFLSQLIIASPSIESSLVIGNFEISDLDPFFIWLIVSLHILLMLLYHFPLRSLSFHAFLRRHVQLVLIKLAQFVDFTIIVFGNFEIVINFLNFLRRRGFGSLRLQFNFLNFWLIIIIAFNVSHHSGS